MVQTLRKTLTLEEFLNRLETKPASEYVKGQVIQKPMPQGKHSKLQEEFVSTVNAIAKSKKLPMRFQSYAAPLGQQPTFFEEPDERLPVSDEVKDLELIVGNVFGWLKL